MARINLNTSVAHSIKTMQIAVLIKENGDFWFLHDKAFTPQPDYFEIDVERGISTLIDVQGGQHHIDLNFTRESYARLQAGTTAYVMFMPDRRQIQDIHEAPVIVHNWFGNKKS